MNHFWLTSSIAARAGILTAVHCGSLLVTVTVAACGGRGQEADSRTANSSHWCVQCEIVLTENGTIGRPTDSVAILFLSSPASVSGGRHVVAPIGDEGQIGEYAVTGELIRVVGKLGEGPDEFSTIRDIQAGPGDSIVVLDQTRLTMLSPELKFVRSTSLPVGLRPSGLVVLVNGHLVLNDYGPSRRPFSLLDASFGQERQFGPMTDDYVPSELQYVLAADPLGGFWASKTTGELELLQFDADGEARNQFQPRVDWFPTENSGRPVREDPSAPAKPRVAGIARRDSTLWLLALVPDPKWRPSRERRPPGREGPSGVPSPREWSRRFDSIVAALDPASGQVIALMQHDEVIAGFTGNGSLWAPRESESGLITFELWDVTLQALPQR